MTWTWHGRGATSLLHLLGRIPDERGKRSSGTVKQVGRTGSAKCLQSVISSQEASREKMGLKKDTKRVSIGVISHLKIITSHIKTKTKQSQFRKLHNTKSRKTSKMLQTFWHMKKNQRCVQSSKLTFDKAFAPCHVHWTRAIHLCIGVWTITFFLLFTPSSGPAAAGRRHPLARATPRRRRRSSRRCSTP